MKTRFKHMCQKCGHILRAASEIYLSPCPICGKQMRLHKCEFSTDGRLWYRGHEKKEAERS